MRYVLPVEIVDNFDLVDLQESEGTLHLYLDERDVVPEGCLLNLSEHFWRETNNHNFHLLIW